MKKTATTTTLVHPHDILSKHLREAIKPHARALREAAAIDLELAVELDATHPDKAKAEAAQLLERAGDGDTHAEGILRSAGGTEGYIKSKCAMFDLARAKHEAAAKRTVPLWEKVSASSLSALEAAHGEIRQQWQAACQFLGEAGGDSAWDAYCRNLRNGIERAPFGAETLKFGASWQIERLGLKDYIAE